MKNFYLITNNSKEPAIKAGKEIQSYLISKGANCVIGEQIATKPGEKITDMTSVPKDTECVIVLGGDGTILHAAYDLADLDVVFLGINLGTVGFLASADAKDMYAAVDRMLSNDYEIEERMMIFGECVVNGQTVSKPRALNEIVITGTRSLQMIYYTVYVNGKLLHKYGADGAVVSTPTGSTGYNLSVGGPVINPSAKMIIVTPICSHSLDNRSIVFDESDVIKIVIDESANGIDYEAEALFDASHSVKLKPGDEITITKSSKTTKLVKLNNETFLETLHKKLKG